MVKTIVRIVDFTGFKIAAYALNHTFATFSRPINKAVLAETLKGILDIYFPK